MNTPTLKELYSRYVKYREVSGLSLLPVDELKTFYNFCRRNYPSDPYLTQDKIDRFGEKRPTERNSTHNGRVRCLNHFIRYLGTRGIAHFQEIPLLREDRIIKDPIMFSRKELSNFFKATTELEVSRSFGEVHDRQLVNQIEVPVIFRLLYSTGLRTFEARRLMVKDVDLNRGTITIHQTKGCKERMVIMHASLIDVLKEYEIKISKVIPHRKYYFPMADGDSPHSVQWLCTQFRKAWNKYNDSKVIPYSLRHNYAVENINSMPRTGYEITNELVALSQSMGHSTLASTLYYYHLTPRFAELYNDIMGETINQILPEV